VPSAGTALAGPVGLAGLAGPVAGGVAQGAAIGTFERSSIQTA
jgi:hypothetical protein